MLLVPIILYTGLLLTVRGQAARSAKFCNITSLFLVLDPAATLPSLAVLLPGIAGAGRFLLIGRLRLVGCY